MKAAVRKESGPQKTYINLVSCPPRNRRIPRSSTYSSDGLHAEDKGVLRQVSGVGQRILLPELPEKILQAAHAPEVVRKVSFKQQVDAAAQDKPHDCRQIRSRNLRP